MQFLGTNLAIYKRLTGYPLDSKGRPQLDGSGVPMNREVIGPPNSTLDGSPPQLPSYGVRIPMMKEAFRGQRGLTSNDPDALRALQKGFDPRNMRQVPVFDENTTGRKWADIWPCVTFRWSGAAFNASTSYYADPFIDQDGGSAPFDVTNRDGDVVQSGYKSNDVRPLPEAYDHLYVITVWSKDPIERALLVDCVLGLFPGRGGLTVQWQSGESHTCDMSQERIDHIDSGTQGAGATVGGEEQRELGTVLLYRVEAYRDNTTSDYGVQGLFSYPAILERLLEMDDLQTGLIVRPEEDLNLQELETLPAPIT